MPSKLERANEICEKYVLENTCKNLPVIITAFIFVLLLLVLCTVLGGI